MKRATLLLACLYASISLFAKKASEPDGTYLYAKKDTSELLMDIYEPAKGSIRTLEGKQKPTVIFMFGGGFIGGKRDKTNDRIWFGMLQQEGYRVISIDYRLGLKGVKNAGKNLAFINHLSNAIGMAVEDLFSATKYIIDNATELGIDPSNIVISGSSAGAMTCMQAEYEIINHKDRAKVLPEGFNYAGILSFAGAIFSTEGTIGFAKEPCPIFIAHGISDKLVPYTKIKFLKYHLAGGDGIASILAKAGYSFNFFRVKGHGHEIAGAKNELFPETISFLEQNVIIGNKRTIDAVIEDPTIPFPEWGRHTALDLYNKKQGF